MLVITFELRQEGADYRPFFDTLRGLDALEVTANCWVLSGHDDIGGIGDTLIAQLDEEKDRVFVAQLDVLAEFWWANPIVEESTLGKAIHAARQPK